jgi:hypothetical protein
MEFGDGDGLDARTLARALIALSEKRITNASITANMVPMSDNVPALRDESVNQPPSGARRRRRSLAVIAAVTTPTRMSGAIHVNTATYFSGVPGFAGSLNVNRAS